MTARADAAEHTRDRILSAAVELASERFLDEISLEDVAARAGVAVRTVIRRFRAAATRRRREMFSTRWRRFSMITSAGATRC
jgi:AcrR family transcriptional regulator